MTINEEFFDALVHHQVNLVRYSDELRNKAWDLLSLTNAAISSLVQEKLGKTDLSLIRQWALHREVMALIKSLRDKAWDEVEKDLTTEFEALVEQEEKSFSGILMYVLPVAYAVKPLSDGYKRSLIKNRPINGRNFSGWVRTMRAADMGRIAATVDYGVATGQSGKEISKALFGTKLLKGQDGTIHSTFKQVQSVVRTFVASTTAGTVAQLVQGNKEIFSKERFTAVIDNVTSAICRSLDGKLYNVGEGPIPPLHFHCRSTRIPVLDGGRLADLPVVPEVVESIFQKFKQAFPVAALTVAALTGAEKEQFDEYAKQQVRNSVGGPTKDVTYAEWFAKQSAEFQDEILGKTRGKLYREGGLPLTRFVARDGTQLTLAQLARREALAFKRAGLNPKKYL